ADSLIAPQVRQNSFPDGAISTTPYPVHSVPQSIPRTRIAPSVPCRVVPLSKKNERCRELQPPTLVILSEVRRQPNEIEGHSWRRLRPPKASQPQSPRR